MMRLLTVLLSLVVVLAIVTGCSDRDNRCQAESSKWIVDNYMYIENSLGTKAMLINGECSAGISGGGDSEIEIVNDHRCILRGRFTISFKDGTNIEWVDGETDKADVGSGKFLILK